MRYAICRRQFANVKGSKEERPLLDYQLQMFTLAPHIANAMIIRVSSNQIEKLFRESSKLVEKGKFTLLEVLHHLTSGFKAVACEMSYRGNDEMRQSCGGHGFLAAGGLA